jgi:hypothetical protein
MVDLLQGKELMHIDEINIVSGFKQQRCGRGNIEFRVTRYCELPPGKRYKLI